MWAPPTPAKTKKKNKDPPSSSPLVNPPSPSLPSSPAEGKGEKEGGGVFHAKGRMLGLASPFFVGEGDGEGGDGVELCHMLDFIAVGRHMTDNFIYTMLFWIEGWLMIEKHFFFLSHVFIFFFFRPSSPFSCNLPLISWPLSSPLYWLSTPLVQFAYAPSYHPPSYVPPSRHPHHVSTRHEKYYPLFILFTIFEIFFIAVFGCCWSMFGCVYVGVGRGLGWRRKIGWVWGE